MTSSAYSSSHDQPDIQKLYFISQDSCPDNMCLNPYPYHCANNDQSGRIQVQQHLSPYRPVHDSSLKPCMLSSTEVTDVHMSTSLPLHSSKDVRSVISQCDKPVLDPPSPDSAEERVQMRPGTLRSDGSPVFRLQPPPKNRRKHHAASDKDSQSKPKVISDLMVSTTQSQICSVPIMSHNNQQQQLLQLATPYISNKCHKTSPSCDRDVLHNTSAGRLSKTVPGSKRTASPTQLLFNYPNSRVPFNHSPKKLRSENGPVPSPVTHSPFPNALFSPAVGPDSGMSCSPTKYEFTTFSATPKVSRRHTSFPDIFQEEVTSGATQTTEKGGNSFVRQERGGASFDLYCAPEIFLFPDSAHQDEVDGNENNGQVEACRSSYGQQWADSTRYITEQRLRYSQANLDTRTGNNQNPFLSTSSGTAVLGTFTAGKDRTGDFSGEDQMIRFGATVQRKAFRAFSSGVRTKQETSDVSFNFESFNRELFTTAQTSYSDGRKGSGKSNDLTDSKNYHSRVHERPALAEAQRHVAIDFADQGLRHGLGGRTTDSETGVRNRSQAKCVVRADMEILDTSEQDDVFHKADQNNNINSSCKTNRKVEYDIKSGAVFTKADTNVCLIPVDELSNSPRSSDDDFKDEYTDTNDDDDDEDYKSYFGVSKHHCLSALPTSRFQCRSRDETDGASDDPSQEMSMAVVDSRNSPVKTESDQPNIWGSHKKTQAKQQSAFRKSTNDQKMHASIGIQNQHSFYKNQKQAGPYVASNSVYHTSRREGLKLFAKAKQPPTNAVTEFRNDIGKHRFPSPVRKQAVHSPDRRKPKEGMRSTQKARKNRAGEDDQEDESSGDEVDGLGDRKKTSLSEEHGGEKDKGDKENGDVIHIFYEDNEISIGESSSRRQTGLQEQHQPEIPLCEESHQSPRPQQQIPDEQVQSSYTYPSRFDGQIRTKDIQEKLECYDLSLPLSPVTVESARREQRYAQKQRTDMVTCVGEPFESHKVCISHKQRSNSDAALVDLPSPTLPRARSSPSKLEASASETDKRSHFHRPWLASPKGRKGNYSIQQSSPINPRLMENALAPRQIFGHSKTKDVNPPEEPPSGHHHNVGKRVPGENILHPALSVDSELTGSDWKKCEDGDPRNATLASGSDTVWNKRRSEGDPAWSASGRGGLSSVVHSAMRNDPVSADKGAVAGGFYSEDQGKSTGAQIPVVDRSSAKGSGVACDRNADEVDIRISVTNVMEETRILGQKLEHIYQSDSRNCECSRIEQEILSTAVEMFQRLGSDPNSFPNWHEEVRRTNEVIRNSLELTEQFRLLCRHGRQIRDVLPGSIVLRVKCRSLISLVDLCDLYKSGELHLILYRILTPYIKTEKSGITLCIVLEQSSLNMCTEFFLKKLQGQKVTTNGTRPKRSKKKSSSKRIVKSTEKSLLSPPATPSPKPFPPTRSISSPTLHQYSPLNSPAVLSPSAHSSGTSFLSRERKLSLTEKNRIAFQELRISDSESPRSPSQSSSATEEFNVSSTKHDVTKPIMLNSPRVTSPIPSPQPSPRRLTYVIHEQENIQQKDE